ncbi:E3 ubiquitin-protein ligase RNF181 [Battus philenor]|uniref:E3 ubiquitin-protein ligase RNF181 n=1 Tax=Battus philenor TaxID=42288 RepID=UPI0035D08AB5
MADYFQEMGWNELAEGEQPNHLLHMARFLIDFGFQNDDPNMQWPSLPPPASEKIVKDLPEFIIETEGKNCPICLKEFKLNEKLKKLPCAHIFHPVCILTWLKKTNTCPFCRLELETDNEDYENFKKSKKRAQQRVEDLEILHDSMFS